MTNPQKSQANEQSLLEQKLANAEGKECVIEENGAIKDVTLADLAQELGLEGGAPSAEEAVQITVGTKTPATENMAGAQSIDGEEYVQIQEEGSHEITLPSEDGLESSADKQVAEIEPAAGETTQDIINNASEPTQELARELSDIKTQAGNEISGPIGTASGGGFGFQSSFDAQGVISLDDVGPIDPTALQYGIERPQDELFLSEEAAPLPPLNPIFEIGDYQVYEDNTVTVVTYASPESSNGDLTIVISGIPAGWNVTDEAFDNTDMLVGTGVFDSAAGTWTITTTGGGDFTGGPIFTPPADSDIDALDLVFTVNEVDLTTGQSGTASGEFDIIVDAVADRPDVDAADDSGNEGAVLDVDIAALTGEEVNNGAGADDGSESITGYQVSGVPIGFTLSAGTETAPNSGVYNLTSAEIIGLTMTPPNANYSGSIDLTATVFTTENPVTDGEFDYQNNHSQANDPFTLTWKPVADEPCLKVESAQVKEDSSVFIPVEASLADTDGSEYLSITVHGIPTDWDFSGTNWVQIDVETFNIILTPGDNYAGGFTLAPPADSDIDLNGIVVTATSIEIANNDSASISETIGVIVDAVADAPSIDADGDAGIEGETLDIDIAALTGEEVNNGAGSDDGSENITGYQISGVPAGFTLSAGTETAPNSGIYNLTPAEIVGLTVTPTDSNYFGSVTLTATVFTTENPVSDSEFDPSDNNAQASDPLTLTWKPVINPPCIKVNNGVDDALVKEDGTVDVPVTAQLGDNPAASEFLTITVTGIDPSWGDFSAPIGTYTPGTGTWTITLPAGEALNTVFTFTPNADSDIDLTGMVATVVATDPVAAISANSSDGFNVIVDAVADIPNLDADKASGEEGTIIALDITTSVNDTDGSEVIEVIKIGNLPAGTSLTAGAYNAIDDVWELTPAELVGLGLVVPDGVVGTFTLEVESVAYEQNTNGTEVDLTDNRASAFDTIKVCIEKDDVPVVKNDEVTVDETDLAPTTFADGNIAADFGSDTPGTITGNGSYFVGTLTSGLVPVVVAFNALTNTYTGTAGAEPIFTLVVQSNGDYTFTLQGVIDHPDETDPNDSLPLEFGVTAIDSEGDETDAVITVNVLDDGPTAEDDCIEFNVSEGEYIGNVTDNDDLSQDTPNLVTQIKFGGDVFDVPANGDDVVINGEFGTLTINNTGAYTYEPSDTAFEPTYTFSKDNPVGSDGGGDIKNVSTSFDSGSKEFSFSLTMEDISEGFTVAINGGPNPKGHEAEMALFYFDASSAMPVVSVYAYNGANTQTSWNDGSKAGGVQPADQILNSIADAGLFSDISVTTDASGNKVFSFTMDASDILDHNPAYGPDGEWTGVEFGADLGIWLHPVTGLSTEYGDDGFLTQWSTDGQGWYDTSNQDTEIHRDDCVEDQFEYVLTDDDGDSDPALLKIKTCDDNDDPILAKPEPLKVDETDLVIGNVLDGSVVIADFGNDGPGTFAPTDVSSFTFTGANDVVLRSNGVPVVVTIEGDSYVGKAGAETIFTLDIALDGAYTFTLQGTLDHADITDPDDIINLTFGVEAKDASGDTVTGVINVGVCDDGPVANDDCIEFNASEGEYVGNVVDNDDLSQDDLNLVTQIKFGGDVVDVPANGDDVVIHGEFGTLTINNTGAYTYEPVGGIFGGETAALNPVAADADGTQSSITKNGITVEVANQGNFDIRWVSTHDGDGLGIKNLDGDSSEKVWPKGEAFDISFDKKAQAVTLTISELGSNNNDGRHGLDYVVTLADGTQISGEQQFLPNEIVDGHFTFTIDADDLPTDQLITSVEINSTNEGQYYGGSFLLNNVEVACPDIECVTDIFEYVLTDADGDSDAALLKLKTCAPNEDLIVGQNVDDVEGSQVPHLVNGDEAVISGEAGNDILVGDAGGSIFEKQTQDYNFVFILDVSGSMGSTTNDGSKITLLKDAVESLLTDVSSYGDGEIKVHLVPFAASAKPAATFTITDAGQLANLVTYLDSLSTGGYTNYEDPMQEAIAWLEGAEPLGGNAITTTYFVSDGEPNRYMDEFNQISSGNAATVMGEVTGSDGSDEVAMLNALSDEVIAVGINIGSAISNLDVIDSDGNALNIDDPSDLTVVLADTSPLDKLLAAGGDQIEGGEGNDIIFGDVLFTDDLSDLHGLNSIDGAGWEVFERLENGESTTDAGWSRDDTIEYIRTHAEELAQESVNSKGEGRDGGDDVINGGEGEDLIFGQEGDDVISGGAGDDVLFGGSGADTFLFDAITDGTDTIKDFDAAEGDLLDLSALLAGYDSLSDDIADFVVATESAGNTTISVDQSGNAGAGGFAQMAVLEGVTGLDLETSVKTDTI